ncbi:MAG: hypothetical protein ACKVUT_15060 [Gaiella sp.]
MPTPADPGRENVGCDNHGQDKPGRDALNVIFVLDKSGPMHSLADAVVEGFDGFVRSLRGEAGFSFDPYLRLFEEQKEA